MRIDTPESPTGMFHIHPRIDGATATTARYNEPGSVMRLSTCSRCRTVARPGRMPGMKPPWRWIVSAWRSGSNWIAV